MSLVSDSSTATFNAKRDNRATSRKYSRQDMWAKSFISTWIILQVETLFEEITRK